MMTLAAVAVAGMLSQSEIRLVDADTSRPAVLNDPIRRPTLNSSKIAAIQYRQPSLLFPGAGRQYCYQPTASGFTTCVVNRSPPYMLP